MLCVLDFNDCCQTVACALEITLFFSCKGATAIQTFDTTEQSSCWWLECLNIASCILIMPAQSPVAIYHHKGAPLSIEYREVVDVNEVIKPLSSVLLFLALFRASGVVAVGRA